MKPCGQTTSPLALKNFESAVAVDPKWYKAWSSLGTALETAAASRQAAQHNAPALTSQIVAAMQAFTKAIYLADSGRTYVLQDSLRMLNLLIT